jgi:hypothetical protein
MATFTVATEPYTQNYPVTITASDVNSTAKATLNVMDDSISKLTLSAASIVGGSSSTATVTLGQDAPTGGWKVKLTSGDPHASLPTSLTIPAGATTATFTIKTTQVTKTISVQIQATDALTVKSAVLTIKP